MKTIVVTISTDGSAKVETKGFTGSLCQAASEFLEKALGARQSEKLTAEFYSEQAVQRQIQEGT